MLRSDSLIEFANRICFQQVAGISSTFSKVNCMKIGSETKNSHTDVVLVSSGLVRWLRMFVLFLVWYIYNNMSIPVIVTYLAAQYFGRISSCACIHAVCPSGVAVASGRDVGLFGTSSPHVTSGLKQSLDRD